MSQLGRYAYINAKIRSRVSRMLTREQLESYSRSRTVEQLLHQMEHTPYENLYELYHESADVQLLESYLTRRFIELHTEIARNLDRKYSSLILAFTRKLESENIKSMIRLYFSNAVKGENITYRVNYLYTERIVDDIAWLDMANATRFDEITASLEGTPYAAVAGRYSQEDIARDGLFFLETDLDHIWVKAVQESLPSLNREDRAIISAILDKDGDLKNLINMFRYHALYQLNPEQIERVMFPAGSLRFSQDFARCIREPVQSDTVASLLKRVYPELAVRLSSVDKEDTRRQVLTIEQYLFTVRKREYQALLRGNPFTIGTILSYFFLQEQQDSVVKRLIHAVQYGDGSHAVRESVL